MRTPRSSTIAAIGAASLATLAVGSVTAVQAASAPKAFKACATGKGVLALATKGGCPKGTHPVTLSARGPAGAVGPRGGSGASGQDGLKGATGTTGTTGATGPSDVYVNGFDTHITGQHADGFVFTLGTSTQVVTLTALPAGTYAVSASIDLSPSSEHTVSCYLRIVSGGSLLPSGASGKHVLGASTGVTEASAAISDVVTLTATAGITLACDGGNDAVKVAHITAIKVGQAHVSGDENLTGP